MKNSHLARWRSITLACVLSVFALGLAYYFEGQRGQLVDARWYSIIPPLLAVVLALVTHQMLSALMSAIAVGGFLIALNGGESIWRALVQMIFYPFVAAGKTLDVMSWPEAHFNPIQIFHSTFNIQVLVFVVFVLAMISILLASGAMKGVVDRLSHYAKSARSTQVVTALMGLVVFVDDYANTLIVGSSMRPTTDAKKISREKLAFLVDATSAPVAGVALLSTWIGYQVGLSNDVSKSLGLGVDGYTLFIDALPFRFYCFMMILFVMVNVFMGVDFGPMARAERRASRKGEVMREGSTASLSQLFSSIEPAEGTRASARVALGAIATLFMVFAVGLWIDGGGGIFWTQSSLNIFSLDVWRKVLSQSENNALVLAYASMCGALVAAGLSWWRSHISLRLIGKAFLSGVKGALLPALILILAWSLKETCDGLHTGSFMVHLLQDSLSPYWFPAILFLVAGLTAFSTGTSWATMAILIPTALPIAYALDGNGYGMSVVLSLGAILDGAIFGDHCSPLSDTTIMSSISSSCDNVDHV